MVRGRVELKWIENMIISKIRNGLLKKDYHFSVLRDAEDGLIVFSNHGKLYEFGSAGTGTAYSRMGSAMAVATLLLLPAKQTKQSPLEELKGSSLLHYGRRPAKRNRSVVTVARLFGPAIFEASKLKVLFLGVDQEKHPGHLPRTYTLTHSDVTSKLTLAISQTINRAQLQGWYNRLQRDEVVAEWKKVQGKMSLHVHCHISGGHFLLDLVARLRFYIFCKELPVVLKAFVHGDGGLFGNYPELEDALVWVYFHSNLPEFNRVEGWGPLKDAASSDRGRDRTAATHPNSSATGTGAGASTSSEPSSWEMPQRCHVDCSCCFPPSSLIPWPHDFES